MILGGTARPAQASSLMWSYDHLMHRLDGSTVTVASVHYEIDASLVVCNGVGRTVVSRGVRRWHQFTCTQTVFKPGAMHDITFGIRTLDNRRFAFSYARAGP
jgi:hypothetical protein